MEGDATSDDKGAAHILDEFSVNYLPQKIPAVAMNEQTDWR